MLMTCLGPEASLLSRGLRACSFAKKLGTDTFKSDDLWVFWCGAKHVVNSGRHRLNTCSIMLSCLNQSVVLERSIGIAVAPRHRNG